jgi:copper(I)-binding protein
VTRWNRRLLLGAIAVLVPALAGCEAGFNAPTVEFHPAATGANETVNGVTIDDAFVLGPALNATLPVGGQAAVFLTLEAVNADQLTKVTAQGANSVQLVSGPVTLAANQVVNLSGPQPQIVLTGLTSALSGGQTVQLTLQFANAGDIPITVPVEPSAYDYTSFSPPAPPPSPTPAATPSASTTGSPAATPTASASASASS